MKEATFKEYKLGKEILKSLEMLEYSKPTKVQKEVIPTALNQKDIIVKSQTGSGKTAAFAIPICELVEWEENKPQALILTPTRELALQVKEDFFNIGRFKRIKAAAIYGKYPYLRQVKELKQKTHVVVSTPGRLIDHIEQGTIDTSMIKFLVLDEADEMLNMGFIDQIKTIIDVLPTERMTLLFSATMPEDIESLSIQYMQEPTLVQIEAQNVSKKKISQSLYRVKREDKFELLEDITVIENPDSCIIFCNTKQMVDEVYEDLSDQGYSCNRIHGGMEQRDRVEVMNNFRKAGFRYLIATDVAARGIDVDSISLVINYNVPQDAQNYVHRIGRTGRSDQSGKAITLVSDSEMKYLKEIESYIEMKIEVQSPPDVESVEAAMEAFVSKTNSPIKAKEAKGAKLNKEIIKLHINAGKKTKMRPVDIVGTLCNIDGMTAADIGIISILDVSTFVEILNNKGEMVLKALQDKPIKGRLRQVTLKEEL